MSEETARYQQYLDRVRAALGDVPLGAFAKFGGHLIRKLTAEEFQAADREYAELSRQYHDSIDRGDTVNDVVLRLIREKAAVLLLASP